MTINEWLEISEMSGKGNAKVTLTAPSYEEGETRVLRLAVKGRYGTKYVNIRQDSKAETIVNQYLWVLFEEEGEISGIKSSTIQYSYDRESWISFPSNGSITVPANTYVWFRNTSNELNYNITDTLNMSNIKFSVKGSVGGDLSSMGDMMIGNFSYLFSNNKYLTDASKLILTWDVLSEDCYDGLFWGCTSLVNVPVLPAKTLASNCYNSMFEGCTSLTTAPQLPATTLAERCYQYMFEGCTSLTNAPKLPAHTLSKKCYYEMFRGCTSLETAPELLATELVDYCYYGMFRDCTSLTNAPELLSPTLAYSCYARMFFNCSNLNYIKMLATDINAIACLNNWVEGVAPTGIFVKHPDMNDLTIGVDGIPEGWVVMNEGNGEGGDDEDDDEDVNNAYFWVEFEETGGVITMKDRYYASLTFNADITYSFNGVDWYDMSGDTISMGDNKKVYIYNRSRYLGKSNDNLYGKRFLFSQNCNIGGNAAALSEMNFYGFLRCFADNSYLIDASQLILPWDVLEDGCFYSMFTNCPNLISVPQLPATTLSKNCYSDMFSKCTSITKSPDLLATDLINGCYYLMFAGCSNLSSIKMLGYNLVGNDNWGDPLTWEYALGGWVGNYSLQDIGNAGGSLGFEIGVSPTGTFVKHPNAELSFGADGIPEGWTVINGL